MIEKKTEKVKNEPKPRDEGVELENQFIMRIPEEVAKHLHEALQTGNLKDRLTIKMDNELRYGEVRFDHFLLYTKIVDLPTIMECLKTIDNKNFYKSSDICQIMICKETQDEEPEKESPNKGKKKDPNKVDKKYLWPHGITPPCKNVRKRRFRKTLKKKNVEAPEIEKEVKRLLRVDNEAVKVDFEIINEDIDKSNSDQQNKEFNEDDGNESQLNDGAKNTSDNSMQKDINIESDDEDDTRDMVATMGVGEHDIFGEEVSSSDDDDPDMQRVPELDDTSRLSADDSRMSTYFMGGNTTEHHDNPNNDTQESMEFSKYMFGGIPKDESSMAKFEDSNSNLGNSAMGGYDEDDDQSTSQMTIEQINNKISDLRRQFNEFKMQHAQKAQEISSIQNQTLRQRMQDTLDNLLTQMMEKELEIKDYESMLENMNMMTA